MQWLTQKVFRPESLVWYGKDRKDRERIVMWLHYEQLLDHDQAETHDPFFYLGDGVN